MTANFEDITKRNVPDQEAVKKLFEEQAHIEDEFKKLGVNQPASEPIIFDTNLLTDVENAREIVHNHGQDIRYVSAWRCWIHWNGKVWERLDEDKQGYPQLLKEWAKETAAWYKAMADDVIKSPDVADEYRKHAKRSKSDSKIRAMINLVTGERGIIKSYKDFDNNPFFISLQNGTLNLLTQQFREHRREDYLTKISPVVYDPLATCPLWLAFLERIMQHNPEMIEYLQNHAGQCLTGEVREKAFWIFWGAGGDNGKTTFVETIQYILDEYAQTVPINALLRENKSGIPTDLHSLMGARMASASEPDIGDELTPGMIKRITGKDTMKTRTLHEKPTQWKAQFKLIILTNNQPKITDPSDAMWGRVKCVPFSEKIPEAEQDKQLGEKLKLESSGILNWMLQGCKNWLSDGMKEPEIVKRTVQDYRETSDKLANWIEYTFDKKYDGFVPFKIYYSLYTLWCYNHKIRPVQENTLPGMLRDRGYQINRGYYYNSKNEWIRDRGVFGLQLKLWLSGIKTDSVTEIKDGTLRDRLTGQTIISPVQVIIETMDSDFNLAAGQYGQVDRLNQVESILSVSYEHKISRMSSLSTMSQDSEIGTIPLDTESVQSVQSVLINKNIIILLKDKYDHFNKPESILDLGQLQKNMELYILTELDDVEGLEDMNIMRTVEEYCKVRGW